ncbi:MAG: sugar phosphate isomerase/epimerase family protein [Terrimicrobiaceae bacterium]
MIGFCSIALRSLPINDALERIAASGFDEIEIWYAHVQQKSAAELADLAARGRERGLTFTVLSPYFSFTRGPEKVRESLRTAEDALAVAGLLGIGKIRTFVDVGPDGLPSAGAQAGDWRAACEGLRALCAMDRTREFVVETHRNTLADSLPSVQRLLAEVDEPNLKLNFQANPDFLARGYIACLRELWPHVSHMHWQQILPDEHEGYIEDPGLIDFSELAGLLAEKNYGGTVSVEYCWPDADPTRIATANQFVREIGLA